MAPALALRGQLPSAAELRPAIERSISIRPRRQIRRDAAVPAILELEPAERAEWQARAREALRATPTPVTADCVGAFLP
jgi:hypothetical protein